MISNLAYVHPDAVIGSNVTVEPFAYIEGDVVIGDAAGLAPTRLSTTVRASAGATGYIPAPRSPASRRT